MNLIILTIRMRRTTSMFRGLTFKQYRTRLLQMLVRHRITLINNTKGHYNRTTRAITVLVLHIIPTTPHNSQDRNMVTRIPIRLTKRSFISIFSITTNINISITVITKQPRQTRHDTRHQNRKLTSSTIQTIIIKLRMINSSNRFSLIVQHRFRFTTHTSIIMTISLLTIILIISITIMTTRRHTSQTLRHTQGRTTTRTRANTTFITTMMQLVSRAVNLNTQHFTNSVRRTNQDVLTR